MKRTFITQIAIAWILMVSVGIGDTSPTALLTVAPVILTPKARVYPVDGKSYIPTVPAYLSCLVVDAPKRAVGLGGGK